MGGKDSKFDVVYRGETRDYIIPGSWIFFQRTKECGGGYWLGQAYDDCFVFLIEQPVSLHEGITLIMSYEKAHALGDIFNGDFELTGNAPSLLP